MAKRYALILSGQPRCRPQVIESIIQNIILPNNCDVFGFFWVYDKGDYKYVWDVPNKDVVNRDIEVIDNCQYYIQHMAQRIPFTELVGCKQIDFPLEKYPGGEEDKITIQTHGQHVYDESMKRWNFTIQSQWYSVWAVNEMKKRHEEKHGFKYDGVFRLRTDIFIERPMYFDSYDTSKMHVTLKNDRSHYDFFAFSSSENMNIYCDYFQQLEEVYKEPYKQFSETEIHLLRYLRNKFGPENIEHNTFNMNRAQIVY